MKNRIFRVFFIIAAVIMVIVILAFTGAGISEINRTSSNARTRYNDEGSYLYDLQSGNYADMYTMAVSDTARGGKYTETENELIALGMYFGTAVDRYLCEKAGDTAGAANDDDKLVDYRKAAGEYSSYTDRIDASVLQMMSE